MSIYKILNQIISDQCDSVEQVEIMTREIGEHLNAERNWNDLSTRSQDVLIMWEQECEINRDHIRKEQL